MLYGKVDRKMNEFFTKNIGWKILSLVFAIILWFLVITWQDPLDTRVYKDIPVKIKNEQIFTNQNKHVNYKDGTIVSVRIRGTRKTLDKITKKDITAHADLKEVEAVTKTVPIEIEVKTDKEIEVLEKKPRNLLVDWENIISTQKIIECKFGEGKPANGYVIGTPELSQNKLEITGPESKIRKIVSVVVNVDINNATKAVKVNVEPKIFDENNQEITELKKNIEKIHVDVPIYKMKSVPIEANIEGKVQEGYQLVGYEVLPDKTITIMGKEQDINQINRIDLPIIDISDYISAKAISFDTQKLLNDIKKGILLYKGSNQITVNVEVEKEVQKTFKLPINELNVKYLPEGLQFKFISKDDLKLILQGLQNRIDLVSKTSVRGNVNLMSLGKGKHEIDVDIMLPYGVRLVGEHPKVIVELSKEPKEQNNSVSEANKTE